MKIDLSPLSWQGCDPWRSHMYICMYHILSIHLLMNLSCFHLLALVNNTPRNMGVYLFESLLSVLWAVYLEVGLLDHTVILFLIFWRTSSLFSIVAAPFCISTSSAQGFQFLHILASTFLVGFIFFSIYLFLIVAILMVLGDNLYVFDLHFLILVMLSIFSCAYWPFLYLCRNEFKVFYPF